MKAHIAGTGTAARRIVAVITIGLMGLACNEPPGVNPWRNDAISADTWTTPSEQGVIASNRTPVVRQRKSPSLEAQRARDGVSHYPTWFEDPFEDKGDGNAKFTWTAADYIALPYSPARFLLNVVGLPVSVVVTPPFTPMVSDAALSPGLLGYDHDAAKGPSPDPTAGPEDFTSATQPASASQEAESRGPGEPKLVLN